jgi:hypothetical protein
MPIYGKRSMYVAPEPTVEVDTVEKRFAMPGMPALTIAQMVLVAVIVAYAWTSRKMNGVVISTIALTIGLLHVYDHMYRVKRGPERLFFLPQKEAYGCKSCN